MIPDAKHRALAHVERGLYVFRLSPMSKYPIKDENWRETSTNDPKVIREWPDGDYPVAIDMAKSRLFVVDCDVKYGIDGYWNYSDWLEDHGLDTVNWGPDDTRAAPTLAVKTANGGRHFYYRANHPAASRNSQAKLAPGIDTRGRGGYVVAPGSTIMTEEPRHDAKGVFHPAEFGTYEVISPPGTLLAIVPEQIELEMMPRADLRVTRAPKSPIFKEPRQVAAIQRYGEAAVRDELSNLIGTAEGGRNHALFIASVKVGGLMGAGAVAEPADVEQRLLWASSQMNPAMPVREAEKTILSGLTWGQEHPRDLSFVVDRPEGREISL